MKKETLNLSAKDPCGKTKHTGLSAAGLAMGAVLLLAAGLTACSGGKTAETTASQQTETESQQAETAQSPTGQDQGTDGKQGAGESGSGTGEASQSAGKGSEGGSSAEEKLPAYAVSDDSWKIEKITVKEGKRLQLGDIELLGLNVPRLKADEYPRVDGSTATLPLSRKLYQLSTGADDETAEKNIVHNKTTNSYYKLMRGEADLVIAYEPSEEFYEDLAKSGVEIDMQPIGRDALIFLMNEGNSVTSLTDDEIRDIYSGKITNWKELGGADQEIAAFQRPVNSGSQNLIEKLVMKGTAMMEAPVGFTSTEMGDLIEDVAAYNNQKNALGYSVFYYADSMYSVPGLNFMAVNGVMPSNETIKSGDYPYINEFYAAVRKDAAEDSPERKLFNWLLSPEGQTFTESLGYVSAGETLPQTDMVSSETFDGKLDLGEGKALAVNGELTVGMEGTLIIDGDADHMYFLYDYYPETQYDLVYNIINITGKQKFCKKEANGEYSLVQGVRDLDKGEWVVEPEYNYFDTTETGADWSCSAYNIKKDRRDYFDADWNIVFSIEDVSVLESDNKGYAVSDGTIWYYDKDARSAVIKDHDGKDIGTADFSDYNDIYYICGIGAHMLLYSDYDNGSGISVFTESGEPYFSSSDIPEEVSAVIPGELKIDGMLEGGNIFLIESMNGSSDAYFYDKREGKLITSGEDVYIDGYGHGYFGYGVDGYKVIDGSGKVIEEYTETDPGSERIYSMDDAVYKMHYYPDTLKLKLYDDKGNEYELDASDIKINTYSEEPNIDMFKDWYFAVERLADPKDDIRDTYAPSKLCLYKGGELIAEGTDLHYMGTEYYNGVVRYDEDSENYWSNMEWIVRFSYDYTHIIEERYNSGHNPQEWGDIVSDDGDILVLDADGRTVVSMPYIDDTEYQWAGY